MVGWVEWIVTCFAWEYILKMWKAGDFETKLSDMLGILLLLFFFLFGDSYWNVSMELEVGCLMFHVAKDRGKCSQE